MRVVRPKVAPRSPGIASAMRGSSHSQSLGTHLAVGTKRSGSYDPHCQVTQRREWKRKSFVTAGKTWPTNVDWNPMPGLSSSLWAGRLQGFPLSSPLLSSSIGIRCNQKNSQRLHLGSQWWAVAQGRDGERGNVRRRRGHGNLSYRVVGLTPTRSLDFSWAAGGVNDNFLWVNTPWLPEKRLLHSSLGSPREIPPGLRPGKDE